MERTQEELGKLLLGRRLVRISHCEGYLEDGSLEEFTITGIKVHDHVVALLGSEKEAAFIEDEDLDEFLEGDDVYYYCLTYSMTMRLLPVEEEEHAEEEPTAEEPAADAPAQPKFPGEWRKRWWQFYYHFITADETSAEEAASMADEAIAVARKHLEGEP